MKEGCRRNLNLHPNRSEIKISRCNMIHLKIFHPNETQACTELARKTNNEDARHEKYAQEGCKKDGDAAGARIQAQCRERAALSECIQQHKLRKEASKQAHRDATQR